MKAISGLHPSTGCEDPIPSRIVLDNLDIFIPFFVLLANASFSSGIVPSNIKRVRVTPILKKTGSDPTVPANLRPITGVNFLLKILDRIATYLFQNHLESIGILHPRQSGFRPGRSTETALLDLQNRTLKLLDSGRAGLLVFLDLSAAFDLLDHDLLLEVLRSRAGCSPTAIQWFRSFLTGRVSSVRWGEGTAPEEEIWCGVPQGSCLSPTLFNAYLIPLFELLDELGVPFANYADDTQLLLELSGNHTNDSASLNSIHQSVKNWMSKAWMCLNPEKTELLLVAQKDSPLHGDPAYLSFLVEDTTIEVLQIVKSLGVPLDSQFNMEAFINQIYKSSQYPLRLIRAAKPFLSIESGATAARALILSRLDYCNSLLGAANKTQIARLQVIQNDAVRSVTGVPRREHISNSRRYLHWLPVADRIKFKTLSLAYRCQRRTAPSYLNESCPPYAPNRTVRAAQQSLLHCPTYLRSRYGGRAFPVRAAREWNRISPELRQLPSLATFKKSIKTMLFN